MSSTSKILLQTPFFNLSRTRINLNAKDVSRCIQSGFFVHLKFISSERNLVDSYSRQEECFDLAIIGGGIVGMATAQELKTRLPTLSIAVLEKEKALAAHQSGRNSGVIHGGIYYKPGSLRAKLCVEGLKLMYEYCDKHDIPYKKCGKLIVATNEVEVERLDELMKRGLQNGVPDLRMISRSEIKEIEPYCKGLKAVHSPHTGIVDYGLVTETFGSEFTRLGGKIFLGFKVSKIRNVAEGSSVNDDIAKFPIQVVGSDRNQSIRAGYILTCGGLHSDKLAEMTGDSKEPRIIPFRGEYLLLRKEKSYLVNGNIYPVPDPRLPFLGVHFTPRMNGEIWLGPNALLAFKKEGYRKLDINFNELYDSLSHRGLQKFFYKYFSLSVNELRKSVVTSGQIKDLQKFVPDIQTDDVIRGPSGIRAQAMDLDGNLIEDFVFSGKGRILHCRNAPSPGATSSLAIGNILADKVIKNLSSL